ncbi:hypothetical protein PMYN1_Chma12 (chromatophore) [Paulinella micropora]|uniref:Chromophore lyase CpcS/CpeS n=2 Tax=Paulinella micropora TaxID=1928728 RepID=A0A1S6YH47_9EUKA|nr:hypothetical protein PFK_046 [Paulinella micropora]BBL85825.1 hypothetical protein PMYN1_Chma12 [Paulinella micropora]
MNKAETAMMVFPPSSIEDFLSLCTGQWMALCSSFELSKSENNWHSSEKSMITIELSSLEGKFKQVVINTTSNTATTRYFSLDGHFTSEDSSFGQWSFRTDGSLELTWRNLLREEEEHERIWFTKPNLRLCSKITLNPDSTLLEAKFHSEIRRLNQGII